MSAECLDIIGNSDIIALNQDANVQRAKLVLQYPNPLPFGANTTWVPPQAPPPPEGEPKPPKNATTRGVEIKLQVWVKPLANGDVGVCETLESHPVLGNLRERGFREIWHSPEAAEARRQIRCKACHCTNEVFLWPSIVFQPAQLVRAGAGAQVWRPAEPLPESERAEVRIGDDGLPEPPA